MQANEIVAARQEQGSTQVRAFLTRTRTEILARWRRAARELPNAVDLTAVRLVDHVPELLDELADVAEELDVDPQARTGFDTARRHAFDRLLDGYDITEVIAELALLRDCILALWDEHRAGPMRALRPLHLAIDRAISISVARYAEANADDRLRQVSAERERVLGKLEAMLAASPLGIAFVDRELRFVRINDTLAEVNGVSAAEHLGRRVSDVLPEASPRLEALLRGVIETGEPVVNLELEKRGATPAHSRWFVANYFPVRSASHAIVGVGGMVLEITGARRAQDALRREQALLQSIIEHASAAIWVKDASGRVLVANHSLAHALGREREDIVGRRSDEILPPDLAAQHAAHDDAVLREGRAIEVEETVPSPAGERTFLSVKFPIPGEKRLIGAVATEITERKRMEQELRLAVATREKLLAVVSHDLRNPLGTVQLTSALLREEHRDDPRLRRHLDMIHRSCARMEGLIEDLLDLANIRAGRFHLKLQRERIDRVVEEAIELQEPLAAEQGIVLARRFELADLWASCDRDRIVQVFANLISNAVKFCRSGDTITVTGAPRGDVVVFAVADTGPGIAAEVLPHIFDPYFSSPEHLGHGSGLGLHIVRNIVESHGGRVGVTSTPGVGATFTFTLPLLRSDDAR